MHFIRPRSYCLHLFLFTCLFAFPMGAQAEESLAQPDHTENAPRIESDAERNTFIFIIDGEEVALLDKSGLYIPGSITFGGTMTDAGREWVGDYITGSETADASEGGSNEE